MRGGVEERHDLDPPAPTGRAWLHWIGTRYYPTPGSFQREATEQGVSRRVAPHVLARMQWGDWVYCVMLRGKTGVVFGRFLVERLTGVAPAAVDRLLQDSGSARLHVVDFGGRTVRRGCGAYQTGPTVAVEGATLSDLGDAARELGAEESGRLMVAGRWESLPHVRLRHVPHRQGFRLFDHETYRLRAAAERQRLERAGIERLPKVDGQYYADESDVQEPSARGLVQEVMTYARLEQLESDG